MGKHAPGGCPLPPGNRRHPLGVVLLLGIVVLTVARAGVAPAQTDPSVIDDLVAKAARQGTLRVIVELRLDLPGPPTREAISRAQDQVLLELAGTTHTLLRRYTTIPFLGLAVSADALRRLGGSRLVVGIREDRLRKPQGPSESP